MSHSVRVTLIADQEISIGSELVNVHDIRAVIVNSVGVITQVHKHSKSEESPSDSPASPVQQRYAEISALVSELEDAIANFGRPYNIVTQLKRAVQKLQQ